LNPYIDPLNAKGCGGAAAARLTEARASTVAQAP
jgi:hypothetical protein